MYDLGNCKNSVAKTHSSQANANIIFSTVRVGANLVFALDQFSQSILVRGRTQGSPLHWPLVIHILLNLTAMGFSYAVPGFAKIHQFSMFLAKKSDFLGMRPSENKFLI